MRLNTTLQDWMTVFANFTTKNLHENGVHDPTLSLSFTKFRLCMTTISVLNVWIFMLFSVSLCDKQVLVFQKGLFQLHPQSHCQVMVENTKNVFYVFSNNISTTKVQALELKLEIRVHMGEWLVFCKPRLNATKHIFPKGHYPKIPIAVLPMR